MFGCLCGDRAVRLRVQFSGSVGCQQVLHRAGDSCGCGVVASLVILDHHIVRMGGGEAGLSADYHPCPFVPEVSTVKYRSFKDMKFKGRQQITYQCGAFLRS